MKLPKLRKRRESFYIEIMINCRWSSVIRDAAKECEQWTAQKILEAKANKLADDLTELCHCIWNKESKAWLSLARAWRKSNLKKKIKF